MTAMTLTVDASAKPIGLIPVEDAVGYLAMAELDGSRSVQALLSNPDVIYHSQFLEVEAPIILMRQDYIEIKQRDVKRPTRRVLFARDNYMCQYCGFQATPGKAGVQLTVDHVKPAHMFKTRSAATYWENVVSACKDCNTRKGGKLPMEAKMMPLKTPHTPHFVQVRFAGRLNQAQKDYVCDYFRVDANALGL